MGLKDKDNRSDEGDGNENDSFTYRQISLWKEQRSDRKQRKWIRRAVHRTKKREHRGGGPYWKRVRQRELATIDDR
jgi:hypothetical protein